jgi:hypothetical protein
MTAQNDLTGEILQALVNADAATRLKALQVLRKEATTSEPEPYQTLRQVSKHLHLHPVTLWRWDIPGHSLGGAKRYRLSEVDAYLHSDAFRARISRTKLDRQAKAGGAP